MLTAAADVGDRVAGLALGADDYLPKPFAFAELAARVRALGRRARPAAPPVLSRAGIRLDPHRREVFRDGRYVPLSRKEFAVLDELLRADGAVVSAEQLLEKAWDEHADPFTNVGPGDRHEAAPQARRPAGHRDRAGRGVPDPDEALLPTIRARLTLVYGGLFLLAGLVLLAVTYVLVEQRTAQPFGVALRDVKPIIPEVGTKLSGNQAEQLRIIINKAQDDARDQTLYSLLTHRCRASCRALVPDTSRWLCRARRRRDVSRLQNRQAVVARRLEGSIPSPLRSREFLLHDRRSGWQRRLRPSRARWGCRADHCRVCAVASRRR